MGNRAAQFRADNAGRPVTRRGQHYIEFDLGGGSRRYVATIEPLHYGAANDQEVDDSWQADTGAWQWRMVANRFNLHARSVLNAGTLLEWLHVASGQTVTVQPLGLNWVDNATNSRQQIAITQAVAATASDNVLTWTNGYGVGRHFRYTSHPSRLVKEIVLDSASVLPAPTVANPYLEIEFIVAKSTGVTYYVDGVAWDNATQTTTAGRIEVRLNSTGQVLWYFAAPSARDANGTGCPGIFQLRRQGQNRYCTVRVPKAWVDSAAFPIILDPTLTSQPDEANSKDTNLSEAWADRDYGTNEEISVGRMGPGYNYLRYRGLVQFDVSAANGQAINSATLTLVCSSVFNATSRDVTVHRALTAWYEGPNSDATPSAGQNASIWNSRNSNGPVTWGDGAGHEGGLADTDYASTATATTAVGDVGTYTWDVKADVQAWTSGTTNNGLWILGTETPSTATRKTFDSSSGATAGNRPKLVVDYGGSDTTLTVAESAQTQAIDAVALTQVHTLATVESAQAQTIDAVALTQAHTLGTVESAQAQASDIPTLTQVHTLSVDESAQAQTADSPTLDVAAVLEPAESAQAQSADVPALTQAHTLTAQESAQGQLADSPSLTQAHTLAVDESAQTQTIDALDLGLALILVPDESSQSQSADGVILTQAHLLAVLESAQTQVADSPALTQAHTLAALESAQSQRSDVPTLAAMLVAIQVAVVARDLALVVVARDLALAVLARDLTLEAVDR